MPDQYANYQALQQNQREEIDYRIRTHSQSEALIVLAIHAGGIEMGTSELAQAIAGNDYSLYLFEGLSRNDRVLHLTSTNFDEPCCLAMLKKHKTSLSLHGFTHTQTSPQIYLGGTNLPLLQHLLVDLIKGGYSTQVNAGQYSATSPSNVCNRTSSGRGVQIELSSRLRSQFFEDYLHRRGRENKTPQFEHFVQLIRNALLTYFSPSDLI